jgi:DNA-binding LytR/AlgR family response regulator
MIAIAPLSTLPARSWLIPGAVVGIAVGAMVGRFGASLLGLDLAQGSVVGAARGALYFVVIATLLLAIESLWAARRGTTVPALLAVALAVPLLSPLELVHDTLFERAAWPQEAGLVVAALLRKMSGLALPLFLFAVATLMPRFVLARIHRDSQPANERVAPNGTVAPIEPESAPAAARDTLHDLDIDQALLPETLADVLFAEAEEHYLVLQTAAGRRAIVYGRFQDAVARLDAGAQGLQVHRSYWVADAAVTALESNRKGIRVLVRGGGQVPVSRTFARAVLARFGALTPSRPDTAV